MNGPLTTCGFRRSADFKMASGAIQLKWCAGRGGVVAIHPSGEERSIGVLEVEGDREVIRRDGGSANELKGIGTIGKGGPKLGLSQSSPGVVYVTRIVGLPIRPHQVWA